MKYEIRLDVTVLVDAADADEAEMRAIALLAIAGVRDAEPNSTVLISELPKDKPL